jgi:hypothetical protein
MRALIEIIRDGRNSWTARIGFSLLLLSVLALPFAAGFASLEWGWWGPFVVLGGAVLLLNIVVSIMDRVLK